MIKLVNGDCLVELSKFDNKSVDLFILDLPYGQTECEWDSKIDLEQLWFQLKRLGKDNTAYIFFCTAKFGYELIKSNEKWFRYDLVWNKGNSSSAGFLNARKMPMRNHELIYVFYNKLPTYNILDNHIHKPRTTKKFENKSQVYNSCTQLVSTTGTQWEPPLPKSVLNINGNKYRKKQMHPTEKPEEIIKWLVSYYSKQGDVICDPTMGSGIVGKVCYDMTRNFIGIEKNEMIYGVATGRLIMGPVCEPSF